MELSKLFDKYNLFARIYPVFLLLLPPLITVLAFHPEFLSSNPISVLISIVVFSGLLYLLACFSRSLGKRLESRLSIIWGGIPTTILLRHQDNKISSLTKQRYHQYLASNVPGLPPMPTEAEERQDTPIADAIYSSAVSWLKEQRRDEKKFPVVIADLTEYGFRRNLASLRWVGFIVYLGSLYIICYMITVQDINIFQKTGFLNSVAQAVVLSPNLIGVALLNLLAISCSLSLNDIWVKEAGDNYARALLQTCDA
jgi:hypothetical protein